MDKWLKYLVGISAIIIAGCAAFFSITGLGILFAGASVSVMVMAGSLEYAKLVTATYLKQKWDTIKGFNKWYLTGAVVILMAITSAGIFGYLSNAFQQQNLKLQQVQREIDVWENKKKSNIDLIEGYKKDKEGLKKTQDASVNGGNLKSNSFNRLLANREKETTKISDKITKLEELNVSYGDSVNVIKTNNINLEREVGGFRFVAEAFGMSLNNVVKFFIFLIVIVFDPLAIALVIAFNQLVMVKKDEEETPPSNPEDLKNFVDETVRLRLSDDDLKKLEDVLLNPPLPNDELKKAADEYKRREELLAEIMKNDEELGLYDEPFDNPLMEPTIEEDNQNFSTIYPNPMDVLQNEEENNERMDIIGQNGNEGLHYEEEQPLAVKPKLPDHRPTFVEYNAPTQSSEENTEEEKKNL